MGDLRVNQKELAKVLALTTRQIRRLDEQGLPSSVGSRGTERLYDLSVTVPWYISKVREQSRSSEKEEAEIRERRARAALAELDLEERLGSLVPLSYVEDTLGPVLDDVRAKVVNLPGRVAAQFPNPREVAAILTPATNECLIAIQELATKLERDAGDPLPDDFPGVAVLRGIGVKTFQDLRTIEDLRAIKGIGPKMEKKINQTLRRAA